MLPAAASFKKQGANRGAVASFLVSTPESGIDSIAITYALLDPILTVVRPISAFITGISAGILENLFTYRDHKIERIPAQPTVSLQSSILPLSQSVSPQPEIKRVSKLQEGFRYAVDDIWGDIVFWFFAGLLVAGFITVFIPDDLSRLVLGGGLVSMLSMLIVGMPVYICATASTPIAAALLLKGASPGAVLVFLLAGPATNLTSLSVLISILGKAGTIRYLLVIAFSTILLGLGVDQLYSWFDISAQAVVQEVRETIPDWLKQTSAAIVVVLSLYHVWKWLKGDPSSASTNCVSPFPVKQMIKKDPPERSRNH